MKKHNIIFRAAVVLLPFIFPFLYGCESDNTVSYEDENMVFVGEYSGQGTYLHSFVKRTGSTDYLFLSGGNDGLQIFDVTQKSQLVPIVGYNVTGYVKETYACYIGGGTRVFTASGTGGVSVIDVSDVNSAILDTLLALQGDDINSVFADTVSKVLYAGGSGKAMYVYDISSLPHVSRLTAYQTFSVINEIQVKNNTAYLVQDQGIDIVDVSNPQSPSRLSQGLNDHFAYDIKFSGNIALIANDVNGVLVLDVTNPSSPVQLGFLSTLGPAFAVAAYGNYVYSAENNSGVETFDISNPSNARLLAGYSTQGNAVGITQYDGHVFVSDKTKLIILRYP